MVELQLPWLTASITVPLLAAALVRWSAEERQARAIGITACTASLLMALESVRELTYAGWANLREPWVPALFQADALNAVTMGLFAAIALVTLIAAPRRDTNRKSVSVVLLLTAFTLAAYAAESLPVFIAGFIGSRLIAQKPDTRAWIETAFTTVILGIVAFGKLPDEFSFGLLFLAAAVMMGIFPFHGLAISRLANGSLLQGGLLMNAQLGAFLMVRFALASYPIVEEEDLPGLCVIPLFTTIYTAVRAVTEKEPRRLLALIFLSQSSAILAGLLSDRAEGTTGALVQWIVLAVASTMMIAIYRAIEVRIASPLAGDQLFGLASQMPRLAVFFAISALTLVGLPGTLGFPGEDLLIHGVLSAEPWFGIALPAAIALNAYHLYRLFSRLFLGAPVKEWASPGQTSPIQSSAMTSAVMNRNPGQTPVHTMLDALPRERWALAACLLILLWGGWLPGQVVALRSHAADAVAGAPVDGTATEGGR